MDSRNPNGARAAWEEYSRGAAQRFDADPERRRLLRNFREHPVEGVRPQTAREWLAWRDEQAIQLKQFAAQIAAVMPQGPHPISGGNEAMVRGIADAFLTGELLVWEEAQWDMVREAGPAFTGAKLRPCGQAAQIWTWPGDRRMSPSARREYGIDGPFDLGAILIAPVPEIDPIRLERAAEELRKTGAVSPEWAESVKEMGETDSVLVLYCTLSPVDQDDYQRTLRRVLSTGDPTPVLPRLIVAPHRREAICRQGWEILAAGTAFLAEKIFVKSSLSESRQVRRAYERDHPDRSSDVQVIVLRRTETEPGRRDGPGEAREYHCRWWVGGHWRRRSERWQRTTGPIWVQPYVKGPEDQPLKPKQARIARVQR
jgi:hypothetical protein